MDNSQIYQDPNLVPSEASRSEAITSRRDDHLVGSTDSSSEQIGPELDASNSEKVLPSRYHDLKQIKDQLTARFPSNLKIIPIVGMGGIGKTYLARSIYMDTEISYHFHVYAWSTVSQEYKLRNVLLDLLRSFTSLPHEVPEFTDEQLTEMLYKSLKGKRYLIVLDDMWSSEIWNDFKRIFPNDSNGSRIILTTRVMEVAVCADLGSPPRCMECLNNDESWKLLCNDLFVGKPCPPDLVEIGKGIAKKCQGLPLAIVVVAGHLSKIHRNQDCWADFAERLDSVITGNPEQILDILCLSYNYLPQHLKVCFLYMGIFPKNFDIHVLKLIRLWSAVGFLHSEDEAEKCLEELINRNLIMVRKKKFDGTARTCGIHDLLWDLCLREARKEGHYIFSQSNFRHSDSDATNDDLKYLMCLTSTFLYFGVSFKTDFPLTSISFTQLRVLDIQSQFFSHFPDKITDLIGLSYLELSTRGNIPRTVSKLCKLETLINSHISAGPVLPKEIWCLSRLRHLHVGTYTSLPAASCARMDGSCVTILPDLQTLSSISLACCTTQFFSSIPNLKQLKIYGIKGKEQELLFDCLNNLVHLHQLEKLNLYFKRKIGKQRRSLSWKTSPQCAKQLTLHGSHLSRKEMRRQPQNLRPDTFPLSIKQLTLSGSHLSWEDMNILAMLPNLEVLKLKDNAFKGPTYQQTVEGFPKLKVLLFECLDLEHWIAEAIQFSVLQRLVLRNCKFLEGLPDCFGEITTLESIEFGGTLSLSALDCAKSIQQEQHSTGNYDLQVRIYPAIKVVFKLDKRGYKTTRKAMLTVAELEGTDSISVDLRDKTMIVIGDIDVVKIAEKLRKVCPAELLSIEQTKVPEEEEDNLVK